MVAGGFAATRRRTADAEHWAHAPGGSVRTTSSQSIGVFEAHTERSLEAGSVVIGSCSVAGCRATGPLVGVGPAAALPDLGSSVPPPRVIVSTCLPAGSVTVRSASYWSG